MVIFVKFLESDTNLTFKFLMEIEVLT